MAFKIFSAICILTVAIGSGCADRLILHPWRDPIDPRGAARHEIALRDGNIVEAWVARTPGVTGAPQAYVLEFTGNGTRAEQIASYVADRWKPRAVEVWAINYPGYGGSSGKATMKSIPPAALRAYDEVARIANGKPIFVCGNSLGSVPALYVASQRSVAGLLIQNPPPIKTIVLSEGWWNLWLLAIPVAAQIPDELDAPATARHASAPAVFVTADADTFVLPKFQRLVIDAYAGPKRVMHLTNKGHNDSIDSPAELREMQEQLDWLWSQGVVGKSGHR